MPLNRKNIFESDKTFEGDEVTALHRRMIGLYGDELSAPENADALSTIWGKLYHRALIYENDIRFYDIREIGTCEDGLFNLEVFGFVRKVHYMHKHFAHYRKTNETSITTKYKADLQEKHEHLQACLQDYIEKKHLDEPYKTALQNRIALELVGYGLNILQMPKGRVKAIRSILKNPHYKNAYKQLVLKHMPLHWKVFYTCARYEFAIGIFVLLLCIQKMIER